MASEMVLASGVLRLEERLASALQRSSGSDVCTQPNSEAKPGAHPRLYVDRDKLADIKDRLSSYPYSKFWENVRVDADKYTAENLPHTIAGLGESDIRGLGKQLPVLAFVYLLTGDNRYLENIRRRMDAMSAYENWATNQDIGAAHLLFGMSVTYDWLFDSFTPDERQRYRARIYRQANIFYRLLADRKIWWARAHLQNHNHVNVMSLAVAGVALCNEAKEAAEWLNAAEDNFRRVLAILPADGAGYEGVNYWSYGMEALLRYFMATGKIYGLGAVQGSPYFRNAATYRLHMSLPGFKESADYGDSPRFEWHGPGYILRALAGLFEDGRAQWLAERIERARGPRARYSWADLVWYNENIQPVPPDDLPIHAYFDSLGIFVSRTDWSDDASWFFFKAGPPQGREAAASKDGRRGLGHVHPDQGQFLVWAHGSWLINDDGYVLLKRTSNHNVLTFNGVGQSGEGRKWFNASQLRMPVRMLHSDMRKEFQYFEADLSSAYPPDAGLKKWIRTFIVWRGNRAIIRDEVELNGPGHVESFIHLEQGARRVTNDMLCLGTGSNISFSSLLPRHAAQKLEAYSIAQNERGKYGNYEGMLVYAKYETSRRGVSLHLIAPNTRNCDPEKYILRLSNDNSRLLIQEGTERTLIDFMQKNVTTVASPERTISAPIRTE